MDGLLLNYNVDQLLTDLQAAFGGAKGPLMDQSKLFDVDLNRDWDAYDDPLDDDGQKILVWNNLGPYYLQRCVCDDRDDDGDDDLNKGHSWHHWLS